MQTYNISLTSAIILEVSGCMSVTVRNTVQKTVHTSIWEDSLPQYSTGEILWRTRRRLVLEKEVSVPPPNTMSHHIVSRASLEPAAGYRSGNRHISMPYPSPSGSS